MNKFHAFLGCLLFASSVFAASELTLKEVKTPKTDEDGCYLVHDASELYGLVQLANKSVSKLCIFIEDDIVVNKNVLGADGSLNDGDFLLWSPFENFYGTIDGRGHFISGLYGDVGLIKTTSIFGSTYIQNLGIVDSYFKGGAGSFISNARKNGGILLNNVYSTATLDGDGQFAGGLVGDAVMRDDPCMYPVTESAYKKVSASNGNSEPFVLDPETLLLKVKNSYFAGLLMGAPKGSLGGIIGKSDGAFVSNSFFVGTSSEGSIAGIGNDFVKECLANKNDEMISSNSFFLNSFSEDHFEGIAASAEEFANGTILAKLNENCNCSVWEQVVGVDKYPKTKGAIYGIVYYLNGGVNDAANPKNYKYGTETVLKPASKEGKVFKGWYTESLFKNKIEKIEATSGKNYSLYALWDDGYFITYEGIGMENYNPTYRYTDSSSYKLRDPIWNGRIFDGWYTDSSFTNRITELPKGNTENLTLYAKWIIREIKMNYVLNGGTMEGAQNPDKVVNGEVINLLKPVREGYKFQGWYERFEDRHDIRGEYNQFYEVLTDEDELTLYAVWTYAPVEPQKDNEGCYLVKTPGELYYFNAAINDKLDTSSKAMLCIKIVNDITLNDKVFDDDGKFIEFESITWTPLNTSYPFNGTVYGNGHTIDGLIVSRSYRGEQFYGLGAAERYNQESSLVVYDLNFSNFCFSGDFYKNDLFGGGGRDVLQKTNFSSPIKRNRMPKYDAKGRIPKVNPNYRVLF